MWLQLVYRCLSSLSDGGTVFRRTCKLGLEGIVSKRKDSAYSFGRSPDWLKNEKRKRAGREAGGRGGMDLFVILAPMEDCT
jgi:ATP-dependent DNA ligase